MENLKQPFLVKKLIATCFYIGGLWLPLHEKYIKIKVCSNDNLLQEQLHRTETCFTEINGYPKWLLERTFDSFKSSNKNDSNLNKVIW